MKKILGMVYTFEPAKLRAAIKAERGRATTWTHDAAEIATFADNAEAQLDELAIPQAERIGCTLTVTSAGPSSAAYKFAATGSHAVLVRRKRGWSLESYDTASVFPKAPERIRLELTHDDPGVAFKRFMKRRNITLRQPYAD